MPAGRGFWLPPPDGRWPPEIDMVEMHGYARWTIYLALPSTTSVGREVNLTERVGVPDTSADSRLGNPDATTPRPARMVIHLVGDWALPSPAKVARRKLA
jgi:hypothetical protein